MTVAVMLGPATKREGEAVGLRERVGLTVSDGDLVRDTEADPVHVALAVICVPLPEGERVRETDVVRLTVPVGERVCETEVVRLPETVGERD